MTGSLLQQGNCTCIGPMTGVIDTDWPSGWSAFLVALRNQLPEYFPIPNAGQAQPAPTCDTVNTAQIPENLYDPGVFTNFCNSVNQNPGSPLGRIVDAYGDLLPYYRKFGNKAVIQTGRNTTTNNTTNTTQFASGPLTDLHRKRTMSPYIDYTFDLIWTGGDRSCNDDCMTAFSNIANSSCK